MSGHEAVVGLLPKAEVGVTSPDARSRRIRKNLTFIPEKEAIITHRLHAILAGSGAGLLAEKMEQSEKNDAYRPIKKGSQEGDDEGVAECDVPTKRTAASTTQGGSSSLVVFCPGEQAGELVRVRFCSVEGFSASMPTVVDEEVARATLVIFVYWKRSTPLPLGDDDDTVDRCISDFQMRVAEIRHGMKYPPLLFLLTLNESDDDRATLEEFIKKCRENFSLCINMITADGDDEEDIMTSMYEISDAATKERDRRMEPMHALAASTGNGGRKSAKPVRSNLCALS